MLINKKKYYEPGIFFKHNDFPILTQEEEKNRIIEFYFHIKTKITIDNWMKTINQDKININTKALTEYLLVILSEIYKSEDSNNELLEEIKKILLLCATKVKKCSGVSKWCDNRQVTLRMSNLALTKHPLFTKQ